MPTAESVFALVDKQDSQGIGALLAPRATFAIGNREPANGRDEIVATQGIFFTLIQELRHELVREWAVGDATIAETKVTYTRLDGREVTVPAVSIWIVDEAGLITDFRVFVDQSPVFTDAPL
jgi:ketosteroid isomerase-like protein